MSDLEGFYMDMEDGVDRFPFLEDENANITGYGHQDKATFAAEINRYPYCIAGGKEGHVPADDECCDDCGKSLRVWYDEQV